MDFERGVVWRCSLDKLRGAHLFICYRGPTLIVHTIASWEFADGSPLAVSIETRKEQGESYSAIRGFFRQYELYYVVADERDLLRLRTNYRVMSISSGRSNRKLSAARRRGGMEYFFIIFSTYPHPEVRFPRTGEAECCRLEWSQCERNRVCYRLARLSVGDLHELLSPLVHDSLAGPYQVRRVRSMGPASCMSRVFLCTLQGIPYHRVPVTISPAAQLLRVRNARQRGSCSRAADSGQP